jgi:release factor glutamine methyltransferase
MSVDFSTVMQALIDAGIASPRLETRLLLAEVLQQKPSEINENTVLDGNQQTKVQKLLRRRLQHEPLDKILEHKEFYKFDFRVSKDVLSPRPDTEILVESALEYIPQEKKVKILDLGTGSGCIIISLLLERLNATGDGVDASAAALAVARDNMRQYGLENRLELIKADWFDDDFEYKIKTPYDFIVTNPPYIKTAEIANLEIEVRKYDPLTALDGGKNGYESYCRIAELAPKMLKNNGYIFIEAGCGQAENIVEIFSSNGLIWVKTINDLSGIARCIIMQKTVAD